MSISTITISSVDYMAYASVAEADTYLVVDPVRASTWTALTADQKGMNLIAASRRLDMLPWTGEKAGGASQEMAFPRSGMTYSDGTAVADDEVPQEVENACILLAGSIAISSSKADYGSSGDNKKRVKAGSAEVEYFRPKAGKALQDESAFALVRQFLQSAASAATGMLASGTSETSEFLEQQSGYGLSEGYS